MPAHRRHTVIRQILNIPLQSLLRLHFYQLYVLAALCGHRTELELGVYFVGVEHGEVRPLPLHKRIGLAPDHSLLAPQGRRHQHRRILPLPDLLLLIMRSPGRAHPPCRLIFALYFFGFG